MLQICRRKRRSGTYFVDQTSDRAGAVRRTRKRGYEDLPRNVVKPARRSSFPAGPPLFPPCAHWALPPFSPRMGPPPHARAETDLNGGEKGFNRAPLRILLAVGATSALPPAGLVSSSCPPAKVCSPHERVTGVTLGFRMAPSSGLIAHHRAAIHSGLCGLSLFRSLIWPLWLLALCCAGFGPLPAPCWGAAAPATPG